MLILINYTLPNIRIKHNIFNYALRFHTPNICCYIFYPFDFWLTWVSIFSINSFTRILFGHIRIQNIFITNIEIFVNKTILFLCYFFYFRLHWRGWKLKCNFCSWSISMGCSICLSIIYFPNYSKSIFFLFKETKIHWPPSAY